MGVPTPRFGDSTGAAAGSVGVTRPWPGSGRQLFTSPRREQGPNVSPLLARRACEERADPDPGQVLGPPPSSAGALLHTPPTLPRPQPCGPRAAPAATIPACGFTSGCSHAVPADRELRHHREHADRRPGRPGRVGRLAVPAALRLAQRVRGDPRRREGRAVPDRPGRPSELRHKQYYWPDTNVLVTRFLHPDGIAEVEDYMPVGPGPAPDAPARPPGAGGPRPAAAARWSAARRSTTPGRATPPA